MISENVRRIYPLLKIVLLFSAILILLVFYTPLAYWMTKPLSVEQVIEKSDCALVLSGGSYPNGQLSSFSLERTLQGIKLYRDGMTNKILFTGRSGENQNDSLSMKKIAVSLGINEDDIVVEEKSLSTHENIAFSSKLLDENNCKKVLLVTSPIHLKRALIVAKEVDPKVQYLPAAYESYDKERKHPLDRLILFWFVLREYVGIMSENFF